MALYRLPSELRAAANLNGLEVGLLLVVAVLAVALLLLLLLADLLLLLRGWLHSTAAAQHGDLDRARTLAMIMAEELALTSTAVQQQHQGLLGAKPVV
jgi:hypothetical protein